MLTGEYTYFFQDPFKVTEEFVSEHVTPVQNARQERPSSYAARDSEWKHDSSVTSPRTSDRTYFPQDRSIRSPVRSTLSPGPQGPVGKRPVSQQETRTTLSSTQRPWSQQDFTEPHWDDRSHGVSRSHSDRRQLSHSPIQEVQAYEPVIGQTVPMSQGHGVRPMSPPTSPLSAQPHSGAPLSPIRTQPAQVAGPMRPVQSQPAPLSPVYVNTGPTGPLSPTRTQSERHGYLSPIRSHPATDSVPVQSLSPHNPPSSRSSSGSSHPLSPSQRLSSPLSPIQYASSSHSEPRSPIPAPVTFTSPQPLPQGASKPRPQSLPAPQSHSLASQQRDAVSQAAKPKFVPYTMKDLEEGIKSTKQDIKSVPAKQDTTQPKQTPSKAETPNAARTLPVVSPAVTLVPPVDIKPTVRAVTPAKTLTGTTTKTTTGTSTEKPTKSQPTPAQTAPAKTDTSTSQSSESSSSTSSSSTSSKSKEATRGSSVDRKTPPSESELPTRVSTKFVFYSGTV